MSEWQNLIGIGLCRPPECQILDAVVYSSEHFYISWQVSIPCKKRCYRLYGKEGYALLDIMSGENEPAPKVSYFC
jgi:Nicotinate phosphoribosyltransferase C-terminal domain